MLRDALRASIAMSALVVAGCSAPVSQAPKYAIGDCARVALVDPSGAHVGGAEDLAVDPERGRLIVSAYDRRAVAKAVKGAMTVPEGGLYAVSLVDLAKDEAAAAPIVASGAVAGGLRPHGLAYVPQTDEIAFINRGYHRVDGKWRIEETLQRVSARDGALVSVEPARCAANDLLADETGLIVSFDHGACDWRRSLEDTFALRRSGVGHEDGAALYSGASYANGVIDTEKGLALAATRENALLILGGDSALDETSRVKLPGGPDNLTHGAGGSVIAAVHPSMARLAGALKLGWGKAPSRVVEVDPATTKVQLLFDDRSGKVFSGATVALERDGKLILGSATDEGLLVCHAADPHA